VTAASDAEIDAVIARFDAPARPDGLSWPDPESKLRLVVATATDGQLRAVMRRLVRRYAPPPSKRPADLADNRTVPDLPPVAILPLDPANRTDLAAQLGLPREPSAVAAAVLGGTIRRLDLLRNDGGSVTVDGALVGGVDDAGAAVPWRGRIEVDDAVLSDGTDRIIACAIGNAGRLRRVRRPAAARRRGPDRRPGRGRGGGPGDRQAALPEHEGTRRGAPCPRRGRLGAAPRRRAAVPRRRRGRDDDRKRSWWTEPGAGRCTRMTSVRR
jgi:hypothetical protein